jgi:hypothetical protein
MTPKAGFWKYRCGGNKIKILLFSRILAPPTAHGEVKEKKDAGVTSCSQQSLLAQSCILYTMWEFYETNLCNKKRDYKRDLNIEDEGARNFKLNRMSLYKFCCTWTSFFHSTSIKGIKVYQLLRHSVWTPWVHVRTLNHPWWYKSCQSLCATIHSQWEPRPPLKICLFLMSKMMNRSMINMATLYYIRTK